MEVKLKKGQQQKRKKKWKLVKKQHVLNIEK